MRALGKSIAFAVPLLFLIPSIAGSRDNGGRERGKEFAYEAGFDDGYREGYRHGNFDRHARARFDYHSREYDRAGGFYAREFGHEGHYKKGYRDGYRRGYKDGYRKLPFPRYEGRHLFRR